MVRSEAVSLNSSLDKLRRDLLAIVRAGIAAADPARLTERALRVATRDGEIRGRCHGVAAGKAATAMAGAAATVLGDRVSTGLVVAPDQQGGVPAGFEFITGGHPLPDERSEAAGRRALAIADAVAPDDTLLVLLSGGASALMAVPAGVTLEDKRRTTAELLRAGADIHALNTVRKHLSNIKGGWLAARCRGACRALVISDVVDDDLSVIASGPTVGDATTYGDAIRVLERLGGAAAFPPAVVARLEAGRRGEAAETPKPGDPRVARASTIVIGGRRDAKDGARAAAEQRGYAVVGISDAIVGEAREAGASLAEFVASVAPTLGRPVCFVSCGETTVRVTGGGRGGRNQELALAFAVAMERHALTFTAASVGTDGVDGPTDAAGAVVDSTTLARAARAGLALPAHVLADNDTYAFFAPLGDLLRTGPTGTNVGDLQVVIIE